MDNNFLDFEIIQVESRSIYDDEEPDYKVICPIIYAGPDGFCILGLYVPD